MIRFCPYRGKFVLNVFCSVPFEHVDSEGVLRDDLATGLGEAYLTPAQLGSLIKHPPRATNTWAHRDGRTVTLGPDQVGEGWRVAHLGRCQAEDFGRPIHLASQAEYREFVQRLQKAGFRPVANPMAPPPIPPGREPA